MNHLRLLRALRGSLGLTAPDIARVLGLPSPSVRRLVSELRRYGVTVEQSHGFYCLRES